MTYNKQIELLESQILDLQNKIKIIQSKCDHKNVTKKYGSNTGNLSEVDDMYWTDFACPNCKKRWSEKQK
jgi:hypothetical protein